MMEPNIKLDPCPFCGSEAILEEIDSRGKTDYYVRCSNTSECCIEQGYSFNLEEAVEAWNKRTYKDKVRELVKELI